MKRKRDVRVAELQTTMTATTPRPRLLGISGSLRKGSFNTAILESLGAAVEAHASLQILPLNDLPLYDQDADTATPPEPVARLRAAIAAADGLVIASPEYNHSISGVLKNALDWASRPFGQSTLSGKPVLTLTSSTAFTGGVRAQAQLNEVLTSIAARLVHRPQSVVGSAHQKIVDGRLVDEATLDYLQDGIDDLLRLIPSPG
ncbi:MAG: NADPH-dependent reductase [Ramlibacter sp.]|nr:NADPH-dependent reductase [Ramlibacter sp.]